MLRRRTPPAPAAAPPPADAGRAPSPGPLVTELADAGWALPRLLRDGPDGGPRSIPTWTLVGTVDSPTATPVDPAGLVVGDGWSLDWWIGADDRWHLPSQAAAVRQDLLADAPIVETRVRIPGGDALHRAYGIRAGRGTGDEWVVAEVVNATPVPFAVALVLRPFVADAVGSATSITIEPVAGGRGRDVAHLLRVDGTPAVVLPRRPARLAVGSRGDGDAVEVVTSGAAGEDLLEARCPSGLATLACIFPLPHTASLRALVPVGPVDPDEAMAYPPVVPDAETVASGWEVHARGPRFEVPERRLEVAIARARRHLALAHDGGSVRRDGHRSPALEPGATEHLLAAFDVLDRPAEVGPVLARWIDELADPTPEVDAMALAAIAHHWTIHRVDALLDWLLPEVAAAVERLDRARRRGALAEPAAAARAAGALAAAEAMLTNAGQPEAARAVAKVTAKLGAAEPARPTVDDLLDAASATTTWPGPGPDGRPIGDDLVGSASLVLGARALLVDDEGDELSLLRSFPDGWYGHGVELHDAPTRFGRLSFAIRWHGARPALLWELEPHDERPVTIAVPGLDPTWRTVDAKGDALLAEVAPPEGLDLIQLVAEHPDIDPSMRRPGEDPGPAPPELPDGGSFS